MAPRTLMSKKGSVKQPKKSAEPLPALSTCTEMMMKSARLPNKPPSAAQPRFPTQAVGEMSPAAIPSRSAAWVNTKIS